MFESDSQKRGGVYKTPSARPSIHSHLGCPFATVTEMGGYGLDKRVPSPGNQGTDVVDHAWSKLANPIELPSSSRRKLNITKRNSMDLGNKEYTEDDTDVLSKSVPATLPSQLYSRDDSDEETQPLEHETSKQSNQSFGTTNHSNFDRSNSFSTPSHNLPVRSFTDSNIQEKSSNHLMVYIICAVGMLMAVYANMFNVFVTSKENIYDQSKFYDDLCGLGAKYNVDEYSLLQVQTGISTIFEKQDTGSFIFVYNSFATNYSPSDFNKFIHDISSAAAKYLRNDSTPVHYTKVEGNKLKMDEHGELIARYRQELDRTGLMLVHNVDSVPSELAMAFHYYCDEYNPLVKKSAVFFTLNLGRCPGETDKSIHALIEKCLAYKWDTVPRDSIGPLLTRVVSVVIDVSSAF